MGVQQVICAVCVVFLIVLVVIVLTHDADSDLVAGGKANSCPAGKYGNQTGQTVSSSCVSCRSGRFALGDGNERCSLCPKGSYCPNAVSKILCSVGKYGTQTGQTVSSACNVLCSSGKCEKIKNCAQGTYTHLSDCPLFLPSANELKAKVQYNTELEEAKVQIMLFALIPFCVLSGVYVCIGLTKSEEKTEEKLPRTKHAATSPSSLEMVRIDREIGDRNSWMRNPMQNSSAKRQKKKRKKEKKRKTEDLFKFEAKIPVSTILDLVKPEQLKKASNEIECAINSIKEKDLDAEAACSLIVLVKDRAFHWDHQDLFSELRTARDCDIEPLNLIFEMNTPPTVRGHTIGLRLTPKLWPVHIVGLDCKSFWNRKFTFPLPMNLVPELEGAMKSVTVQFFIGGAFAPLAYGSPLCNASLKGDGNAVKRLLKEGFSDEDFNGVTPFLVAFQKGHTQIMQLILQFVNEIIFADKRSYDNASDWNFASFQEMNELFSRVLDTDHFYKQLLEKILHSACRNGIISIVKMVLEQNVCDINAKTKKGVSASGIALKFRHFEIVKMLKEYSQKKSVKKAISDLKTVIESRNIWSNILDLQVQFGANNNLSDALDVSVPKDHIMDSMKVIVPLRPKERDETAPEERDETAHGYLFNTVWTVAPPDKLPLEQGHFSPPLTHRKRFPLAQCCFSPPSTHSKRLQNTGMYERYSPLYDKYGVNAALNGSKANILDSFIVRNIKFFSLMFALITLADMVSDMNDWLTYRRTQCINFSAGCDLEKYTGNSSMIYDMDLFQTNHKYSAKFNLYSSIDDGCAIRFLSILKQKKYEYPSEPQYGHVERLEFSMFSILSSPFVLWYDYVRIFAFVATLALVVGRKMVVFNAGACYQPGRCKKWGCQNLIFPCIECSEGSECSYLWYWRFRNRSLIPTYLTVYLQWLIIDYNFLQLAFNICYEDGPSLVVKAGELLNEGNISDAGWRSFIVTCLLVLKMIIQCLISLVQSIRARACLAVNTAAVATAAATSMQVFGAGSSLELLGICCCDGTGDLCDCCCDGSGDLCDCDCCSCCGCDDE